MVKAYIEINGVARPVEVNATGGIAGSLPVAELAVLKKLLPDVRTEDLGDGRYRITFSTGKPIEPRAT